MTHGFTFCHVPLCCLGVIGSENVVQSVFVIKLELYLLRGVGFQHEAQQGLTLQGSHILRGDTIRHRGQRTHLHLSEQLAGVRADLARCVGVQDLAFDDKPQPLPVLFTGL